jgi:hypothetical protein
MEVKHRREIIYCIIETIRSGLSYSGIINSEATYSLFNDTIDHYNFLEFFIFLNKCDPLVKNYLKESCEKI